MSEYWVGSCSLLKQRLQKMGNIDAYKKASMIKWKNAMQQSVTTLRKKWDTLTANYSIYNHKKIINDVRMIETNWQLVILGGQE